MGTFYDDGAFPLGATKERPKKNGEIKKPRELPQGESAYSLLERDVPSPVRLCDPWATEGVNMIAGRPKLGKTTLERQKMAAAATGGKFLDAEFKEETKCIFLSLEEGLLLTREKFKMANFCEAALASIDLYFEWPRGWDGADMLDQYLTTNTERKLVVIDSLTKFRTPPDTKTAPFQADYNAISDLHNIAKKHPGVCIDIIHHTRKGRSEDPIDDVSGTYGLTAACDSISVLRPHADGAQLFVQGRLWQRHENQYLLKKENGSWTMLGADLGLTDEQKQTFELVKAASFSGMGGKELSDKLGITTRSAWDRLDGLFGKGLLDKRFGRVFVKS